MYHDLLCALNGITGDIFKEKLQKNGLPLVTTASGFDFIDSSEEYILNDEILPLASNILFLQRFVDTEADRKKEHMSYYFLILQHAVEELLDYYNNSLLELEKTILESAQDCNSSSSKGLKMNLAKIQKHLLPWYSPITILSLTLHPYLINQKDSTTPPKKITATIIDKLHTIAETNGNYHCQRWFTFLANKCSNIFINQTKELLFKSELIDPFNDYFLIDQKNFEIDYRLVPNTLVSQKTLKDIVFIARTNRVVTDARNKHEMFKKADLSFNNQESSENLENQDETPTNVSPQMESIFNPAEYKNYKMIPTTLESDISKLKEKANNELTNFVGKERINKFLNYIKKIYFLEDSVTWKEFLKNFNSSIMANKKFNECSEYRYDHLNVNFIYGGSQNQREQQNQNQNQNLDQTFVDQQETETAENISIGKDAYDIYNVLDEQYADRKSQILSKMQIKIDVPYPLNLIFDEWSMNRYNQIWRFLLRLTKINYDLEEYFMDIRKDRTKISYNNNCHKQIYRIHYIIKNLRAYLFSDVIENLLAHFLSGNNFFNDDFEIVINSHRKFVLGFLNRGFLQNKTVLKLLAGLLYHIETYVIMAIKQSENSTAHYREFENGLQVMFNLLKRESSFGQYKSYNDCKFLEMFLLRLNFNKYYDSSRT